MTGISNIQAQFQAAAQSLGNGAAGAANAASGSAAASGVGLSGIGSSSGVLGAQSPSYDTPFSGVLRDAISKTQQLDDQASHAVTGLLSGQGVDVHSALIATEKSDLAFEMMLALRNKAVGAYQQLMGMQF